MQLLHLHWNPLFLPEEIDCKTSTKHFIGAKCNSYTVVPEEPTSRHLTIVKVWDLRYKNTHHRLDVSTHEGHFIPNTLAFTVISLSLSLSLFFLSRSSTFVPWSSIKCWSCREYSVCLFDEYETNRSVRIARDTTWLNRLLYRRVLPRR